MQILGFPENLKQAQLLSESLGWELGQVNIHHFPDGECLVTLPDDLPETVVIFRSLYDPNAKLIELIFALQAARGLGCQRIILVTPYLCYMRQDMAFKVGQAVSQQIIAQLLSSYVDDLITVDPHLHRINSLDEVFSDCRTYSLSAAPLLGDFINRNGIDALLVAPDEEALQWVEQVANASRLDYVVGSKQRISDREVKITLPVFNFQGKRAVIVDDVISSGKTVLEAAYQLRCRGVTSIDVMCTHALFAAGAEEVMESSGIQHIISANAIPHHTNQIDLSPIIADTIKNIL